MSAEPQAPHQPAPRDMRRPTPGAMMPRESSVHDVGEIYELLGHDAILLPLPRGTKRCVKVGWPKTKLVETKSPSYQENLAASDVAVLLGTPGARICSIDCDSDEAAEALLSANPCFLQTLRTRGARGCNFWIRVRGDIPKACPLHSGDAQVGEWRADGNCTKIAGTHPDTGRQYQWLVEARPMEIAFDEIVWPEGWAGACILDEFERLVKKWGVPGYFTTDQATGEKKLSVLNQPYWAARVVETHDCLFEPSESQFYTYTLNRGLWVPKTRATLRMELGAELRQWGIKNDVEKSVVRKLNDSLLSGILRLSEGVAEAPGVFSRPRKFIHAANGMVDITATAPVLMPFDREYFSRNQSPFPWLPQADCPRFREELLGSAIEAEDIALLQRWAGSVLLGGNSAQRIMLITGTAGGGKGTLMEIIEQVVGPENVAQLRTEHLAERFELGRIVGRTLLCGKDVAADFLQEKGAHVLKALVGHDLMTGERKGGNCAINFRGDFAVAIVANSRLRVRLQGDAPAWRRRLIVIDYTRPKPEHRIDNFARLLLSKEGPGILRWAVEGAALHLQELKEHGDFRLTPTQIDRVDALLSESDSLRRFAEEHLVANSGKDVTGAEIVEAYVGYCDCMGWSPLPEATVHRQLPDVMLDLFRVSRRQDIKREGRSQRGFKGVSLTKMGEADGS